MKFEHEAQRWKLLFQFDSGSNTYLDIRDDLLFTRLFITFRKHLFNLQITIQLNCVKLNVKKVYTYLAANRYLCNKILFSAVTFLFCLFLSWQNFFFSLPNKIQS